MKARVLAAAAPLLISTFALLLMFCLLAGTGSVVASPALASPLQTIPTVAQVNPASAPNDVDTALWITGSDYISTPAVYLGNTRLSTVMWVSATLLEAEVPWGMDAGVYTLTVQNPQGESGSLSNAFTVTQGIGAWTTDGPYGGSVHGMAMDEIVSSTLYAGLGLAGADGFFKSVDGGLNWANSFPGNISTYTPLPGFALKPGDPQTIYLSGRVENGDKLFRSTNGGEDWTEIWQGGSGIYVIGVSPGDPQYVYVGSGASIVLSTDAGDSFSPANGGIPNDATVSVLAVHPVTPTVAYAGIEPGLVYKTADGGGSWTQIADLGDAWWSALVVDPHAPERLYASGWHTGAFFSRSLDGGLNWTEMKLAPDSLSVNDISFHPTISGTMYVIAPGVYSSTNAGATWNKVAVPDTASEGWSLLLHPQTGLPAYIGHNGRGVLYSANGGVDWETRSDGLAGLRPHEIAASPSDPRYIYVGADESGGFATHDGGQSWIVAEGDWLDRGISVAVHPITPTIAFLGARRDVFKTTDGGLTWIRHELPGLPSNNEMRVHALAIDPNDSRVVYAGPGTWDFTGGPEYGWLYRSLDQGETWNVVTITLAISAVTDIEIDPTDGQTIYVATGRRFLDSSDRGTGVLKTTDGGETWAFVNQGLTARSISRLAINPDNPMVVYAGAVLENDSTYSGVYKTIDGGENWQQVLGDVRVSGLAIDPLVTDTVYIGTYFNGIFCSTDGGATWEREPGPLGQLSIESMHIVPIPDRTIIYAGVAGGLLAGQPSVAAAGTPDLASQTQFYGGGVYQITLDRRSPGNRVYLPLILRN